MSEMNTGELRLKLENLERLFIDIQKQKKAAMKDYNDQLKEIRYEIDGVLEDLDEINLEN